MANMQLKAMKPSKAEAIIAACDEIIENGRCMGPVPRRPVPGQCKHFRQHEREQRSLRTSRSRSWGRRRAATTSSTPTITSAFPVHERRVPDGLPYRPRRKVNRLRKAIDELADSFDEKGAEFRHILTMGRTQLQDAVPMSLGSEFSAFAHTLREEDERLVNNAELLLETSLGATAIGTGLNTPDGYQQVVVHHLRRITGARVVSSPNLP